MDSASSALFVASKDGQEVAVEDDGSLSVAAALAKEAALLFQSGKFVDCLRILDQLLERKEDDPRIHHNIALVVNLQDGCSNPKKLIEALENIKKRSEELVPTRGEHMDVGSNDGRIHIDQISCPSSVYTNGIDTVIIFNIAVTWYHLHEYSKSFALLDALYQNIGPVDEGTSLRICLLLLDVALICQNASRCADVLNYMEKAFCLSFSNHGDIGFLTQQQSCLLANSASITNTGPIPDSLNSDRVLSSCSLETSLSRTLLEEELEDEPLHLLSSLDISGKNLQGRSVIASCNGPTRNQSEDSSSVNDLRLRLLLYKIHLFLITRNLRAAKREVKMAMNLARGKDHPLAFYLKSELEFARRNHRKAIKLLMASTNSTELGILSMYYNNLGCIYHQLGKHHLSGVFFFKALKNSSLLRKEKRPKLLVISQDKSLMISYNCGLNSLACGRPFHAARCFQKASLIFYNRPLLWLRIAECCLMALEKGLITPISFANEKYIEACIVGKGKWRQLALMCGMSSNGQSESVVKSASLLEDTKQPDLSLSYARCCLLNALCLLEASEARCSRPVPQPSSEPQDMSSLQGTDLSKESGDDLKESLILESASHQSNSNGEMKEQKTTNQASSFQNSISDYEYMRSKDIKLMKQAVLADLAYVELALGSYLEAFLIAKSLLELVECSKIYMFLGRIYAAEALCLLNRPNDAANYLMPFISNGNNVELPYTREDCENLMVEKLVDIEDSNELESSSSNPFSSVNKPQDTWIPSPEEARGIFCANYAVNMALLGDLEQAHTFAQKALSDMPNSPRVILTAVYLDLKRGKTQDALTRLKQYGAIRFLPRN